MKRPVRTLIATIVILSTLLGVFVGCVSVGKNDSDEVAFTTDGFTVSLGTLRYFYHLAYVNLTEGSYFSALKEYCSLNNSRFDNENLPLSEQRIGDGQYDAILVNNIENYKDKTWHDYFLDEAITEIENILVLCRAANELGISLDESEKQEIKSEASEFVDEIDASDISDATGTISGMPLDEKLAIIYGGSITLDDIIAARELIALSEKARNAVLSSILDSITLDDINAKYESDPLSYDIVDFIVCDLSVNRSKFETADDEYAAAIATAQKRADKLSKISDADEFLRLYLSYVLEDEYNIAAITAANSLDLDDSLRPSAENEAKIKDALTTALLDDMFNAEAIEDFLEIKEKQNASSNNDKVTSESSGSSFPSSVAPPLPGSIKAYFDKIPKILGCRRVEVVEGTPSGTNTLIPSSVQSGMMFGSTAIFQNQDGSFSVVNPGTSSSVKLEREDYAAITDVKEGADGSITAFGVSISREYGDYLDKLKLSLFNNIYYAKNHSVKYSTPYSSSEQELSQSRYSWLFESARVAGDTKTFELEEDNKYSLQALMCVTPRYKSEEPVCNGAYMVFTKEEDAKAAIEALKAKGSVDLDAFLALAAEKADGGYGELTDYTAGGFNRDVDAWLFDESRAKGDFSSEPVAVSSSFAKPVVVISHFAGPGAVSSSFAVAYFEGRDELVSWQAEVNYDIYIAMMEEAIEDYTEKYSSSISSDEDVISKTAQK